MDARLVGKTIAHLRKNAGYTQKDLALRIGISDKAVSKWERGVGSPDISYLRKLAILLHTDTDSLLTGNSTIQENIWQGILVLSDNDDVRCNTIIYNKPLIDYLISYFLLLGIKSILITASMREITIIKEHLGDGSKLKVELQFSDSTLYNLVNNGSITTQNVMVVYGRTFLYGVDMTRFFQRAMQHRDGFSLLAFPKHGHRVTHAITVDDDKRIVPDNSSGGQKAYDYSYIPFLFCPKELLHTIKISETVDDFIQRLIATDIGYAEDLDRGFVEIPIEDWDGVNEASTFVRIIQDRCGMEIYCLEEIAWRRGMISMEELKTLASGSSNTMHGRYLSSLCERFGSVE